jgi:hypothetical protein
MRLTLLAGVAVLSLVGTAGAQAQTIYTTDPAVAADPQVVAPGSNIIATTPGQVVAVPGPPFGPFTPQYIATQPTIVVAPPVAAPREQVIERERVVVEPRRRAGAVRERVVERQRVIAPRERVVERERTVIAPENQAVVEPSESTLVTTGASTRSCFIDLNGFERCY